MSKIGNWLETFKDEHYLKNINVKLNKHKNDKAITLSIMSGKGGVGKTSFTIKMGLELSKQGNKILLIDCDYNLSNIFVKLGLPLSNNFYSYSKSLRTFDDVIYKTGNLHILAGCNGHLALFEENLKFDRIVMDIINNYESQYDYILLDCPAGLSKEILNLNAYSKQRIIIVLPDKSSITDSYTLIKLLKLRYGVDESFMIVNRVKNNMQLNHLSKTLIDTSEKFLRSNLILLGGISEFNNEVKHFDNVFLSNESVNINKNFNKVMSNYFDITMNGENVDNDIKQANYYSCSIGA